MSSMTPVPVSTRRLPRWLCWRELFRARKQRRFDHAFWGLINDHDWLQYHPFDKRLSIPRWKRWRQG